jgi:hypothetical protein
VVDCLVQEKGKNTRAIGHRSPDVALLFEQFVQQHPLKRMQQLSALDNNFKNNWDHR